MKQMMITIALIGFTAVGSYAQNTKACSCPPKKVVHHKVTTTHKKATPAMAVVRKPVAHKKTISKCAPTVVSYNTTSSYTGNYPNRESNYMRWPAQQPGADGPSTDPDYYLKLKDGKCRFGCSQAQNQSQVQQ